MYKKDIFLLTLAAISSACLAGCKDDYKEYDNSWLLDNDETMTLTASSEAVVLDAGAIDDVALTFTWTPARQMPDDYVVTYLSEIDMDANEFTASDREYDYEGTFSRSFTTEELQTLITGKWGQSDKSDALLSFRVIAKWEGGTKYVMPEVRTVKVTVRPYRPLTFDADYVYIEGSSLAGATRLAVGRTLEDEYKYAIEHPLKAGAIDIPVEYEGITSYIVPEIPGDFQDGVPVPAKISSTRVEDAWQIPHDGDWRIVINMLDKTVTVYSPENEFNTDYVVTWYALGRPSQYPVPCTLEMNSESKLWTRGDTNGWSEADSKVLDIVQSAADPQVFVYNGAAIGSGMTHFPVLPSMKFDANGDGVDEEMNFNTMAVVAPQRIDEDGDGIHDLHDKGKGPDQNVVLGTWMDMSIGADLRELYWIMPSGVNFIVFDFRNMKVRMEKR